MSILQEYAAIRHEMGEKNFECVNEFLNNHPEYLLSDVYYKPAVFEQMIAETNFNDNYLKRTLNAPF